MITEEQARAILVAIFNDPNPYRIRIGNLDAVCPRNLDHIVANITNGNINHEVPVPGTPRWAEPPQGAALGQLGHAVQPAPHNQRALVRAPDPIPPVRSYEANGYSFTMTYLSPLAGNIEIKIPFVGSPADLGIRLVISTGSDRYLEIRGQRVLDLPKDILYRHDARTQRLQVLHDGRYAIILTMPFEPSFQTIPEIMIEGDPIPQNQPMVFNLPPDEPDYEEDDNYDDDDDDDDDDEY